MKKNFRSIEITVKKLLNTFPTGGHVSSLKNSIIDVDVVREYQPGDKRLDSRASLRTNSIMSRVFTPDKSMNVMLVLDVSCSQASKFESAILVCLYLCYLANQSNDPVGLTTFGDRVSLSIQPDEDIRNVTSVLEQIYYRGNLSPGSNLDDALRRIGNQEPSNTLTVLVSDFCFPFSDRIVGLLRCISCGINNVMIAPILANSQEWSFDVLPFRVDFKDSESNDATNWNFGSEKAHKGHLAAFEKWQTDLKAVLHQGRVEPILMQVDKPDFMMPLVKFFLRA